MDLSEFTELIGREFIVGLLANNREILQRPCRPPFMFGVKDGRVTWVLFGEDAQARTDVEEALRARGMIE